MSHRFTGHICMAYLHPAKCSLSPLLFFNLGPIHWRRDLLCSMWVPVAYVSYAPPE